MTYRELPPQAPVIVSSDRLVQAFDLTTGKPLWQHHLAGSGYARLASTGALLAIAVGQDVTLIHIFEGTVLAHIMLEFSVVAAVAHGSHIVLAGAEGLVCLGERGLAWRVGVAPGERGFFEETPYAVFDASGQLSAKLPTFVGARVSRSDYGLCLGPNVAQPDVNT
jgi:hypothetical protein